jgi:urate oxidase
LAKLVFDTYGKTKVRLTHVRRHTTGHEVRELAVKVLFEGDFEAAFTAGGNGSLLPTDTMKNTVYVVAKQVSWDSIEDLARALTRHFLTRVPHLSQVTVEIEEVPWEHIGEHATAFVQRGNERRYTHLAATRKLESFRSGLTNLQILKTANSAFAGFLKDEFTTLPETYDRLFGTILEAHWTYLHADLQFNQLHSDIRDILLDSFAGHHSLSVQQTLFAMGQAVLDRISLVGDIRIIMPNKHCLLFDLKRFGLDNPNEVFVPTDEPSGYIEARIAR